MTASRLETVGRRFDLSGRVALVTGGSKGVGLAIASVLAEAGAAVGLVARGVEALEQAAARFRDRGDRSLAVQADVGSGEERRRAVETVESRLGPVDILVNSAGVASAMVPLLDVPPDHWQRLLDLNLTAYLEMARLCVPGMRDRGWGRVINITSATGLKARPGMGEYGVTKAAEVMLTRSLAVEVGADGVTVNAIAPILMRTEFSSHQWVNPAEVERVVRLQAIPRVCEPEDVEGVALLLASDAGSFITGVTVPVDGGALA